MERCWQLILINTLLLVMLSGCQMESQTNLREGFGNSVKSNMAMHVIDPEAGKNEPVVPDLDGQKAEGVLERYRAESGEVDDERLLKDVSN